MPIAFSCKRLLSDRSCCLVAFCLALLLTGCSTPHLNVPRTVSEAWPHPADTALGKAYAAQLDAQPGLSGVYPLASGMDALSIRANLAENAQRTLDLQYYIVRADTTAQLLLYRVLRAAHRGVRVRLLIDDLDSLGKDADLATLAAFPNIEVRVFNPFANRGPMGLSHVLEFVGNSQRLNRRMHNKLWIADNAMAVVGGRNLGDEYFDASGDINFTDFDILTAGPVVPQISRSFDDYWNSEWAVPIAALVPSRPGPEQLLTFERRLAARLEEFRDSVYARALRETRLGLALRTGQLPFSTGEAIAFYDPPEKVQADTTPLAGKSLFAGRIRPLVEAASQELLLISPYFILSEDGLATLGAIARRGVKVRILTNSLASADYIPLAHAGYARQRLRLLAAGLELYEMRPERNATSRSHQVGSTSGTYLHTKAIVIDRQQVVVGSMNLDPRSRLSNTEVGVLVKSQTLGNTLGTLFDEAVVPSRAFKLSVSNPGEPHPRLLWTTEQDHQKVQYDHDPLVGIWRRVLSTVLGVIAPQDVL